MQLDRINDDGDGTMLYPSGRTAMTVCKTSTGGAIHTFIADSERFQVLATFDAQGLGSVNFFPESNPWLVTAREGWMLCSRAGSIEQRGSWPRAAKDPIICEVTPQLTVSFTSQQDITATLTCGDVTRHFQCGEHLRKPDCYLDKVVARDEAGHLQLDVASIRHRISTIGSVFTPPGPHHFVTQQPGLGNLKSMLSSIAADSPIRANINELDQQQVRLAGLSTLNSCSTSSSSSSSSSRPSSRPGAVDSQSGKMLAALLAQAPYGSPLLTASQQKLAAKLERCSAAAPKPVLKRQKLTAISVKQLNTQLLGPAAPPDVLCAVCVLAGWNPVCNKLEHHQLEAAQWELQQEAAAAANAASSGGGGGSAACAAARIHLYKIDGSESRDLQNKYGFRVVPIFLMFYEGKLVFAGNNIRTKQELKHAAVQGLAAGRRGEFLGDSFSFKGNDMSVLDSITPDMSLLNPRN